MRLEGNGAMEARNLTRSDEDGARAGGGDARERRELVSVRSGGVDCELHSKDP